MQKQITQFKSIVNGIESFFHFDSAISTENAMKACLDCIKWIGNIEESQKSQLAATQAQQEQEQSKVEPIVEAINDQPPA
jgi:hypothetical protein